jgi:thiamine-phosphate pyrophosphorylase
LLPSDRSPLVYLITDRRLISPVRYGVGLHGLARFIEAAVTAAVSMIQIREPDLSARDLTWLAERAVLAAGSSPTRILINDRVDVAAGAGAGVHLTTRSLTPDVVRRVCGPAPLIGASTHSLAEAVTAEQLGADFVVFGPVFDTPSKRQFGPPVGLKALQTVASRLAIPVLALGGVKLPQCREVFAHGAAGVAGISLFTESEDLATTVDDIRSAGLKVR